MARRTTQWFLSLQMTLCLLLIFVRGNEDIEDAYKNGRNLVLEYFLPINLPPAVDLTAGREKRDLEGSGEDDGGEEKSGFSEIAEEKGDNSTGNAFGKSLLMGEENEKSASGAEGSGEMDESSSELSSEENGEGTSVPFIGRGEILTTEREEVTNSTEPVDGTATEVPTSTEIIFDKEETSTVKTEETTTELASTVIAANDTAETTTTEENIAESTTEGSQNEFTTSEETTTVEPGTTTIEEETTTILTTNSVPIIPHTQVSEDDMETTKEPTEETTAAERTTAIPTTTILPEKATTTESPTIIPVVIPQGNLPDEVGKVGEDATTMLQTPQETTKTPTAAPSTPKFLISGAVPEPTEGLSPFATPPTTPKPVVEETFKETKMGKKLEAVPGNILQKENLSLAADPLLIANTRLMDSEENVQLSPSEPKRLGAYIVIGLILLSFSSLVGYITFRKRMNRKRQEFESNQESNDTEKALLGLTDYKDNADLEENHLKNNEIAPVVVKSNSQINKFEKNTNFSSPKNLNTIANEKNIEKDNVLKSTAENLTQVIIEDSPKDVEEDKNVPNLEKLIVKTRIDQDSIPKKPIIINRSSAGYLPIPQDIQKTVYCPVPSSWDLCPHFNSDKSDDSCSHIIRHCCSPHHHRSISGLFLLVFTVTCVQCSLLFRRIQSKLFNKCQCPAHSHHGGMFGSLPGAGPKEYAFEVNNSRVRYGPGSTREIGYDVKKIGGKRVCIMTDTKIAYLDPIKRVLDSLMEHRIACEIFDRVRIEPTDTSLLEAIKFAKKGKFDCFVAVGGGSVIDTCKAANLYSCDEEAEFLDYVNSPIGKEKRVSVKLKPMIAVPTTTGTGSETTGVCVFDYTRLSLKTGISSPALRPTLAVVDPLNTLTLPERVAAYSGFDVLCHALESYTAIPYTERPRPATPDDRPAYQGANPVSDVWAEYSLRIISEYFERAVYKAEDVVARSKMHLASTLAGMGFGNAGVHLCHGMSYAISGNVKNFQPNDYSKKHPIIPHGLSVVITAPAVFRFTSSSNPERHLKAASFLGAETENRRKEDAGAILADTLRKYMEVMKIENGIDGLGYSKDDIPNLVEGTLPQKRINKLAPREQSKDDLRQLFEESMTVY